MREISVKFTSKSLSKEYSISLEDEFALSFERDWREIARDGLHVDVGELLKAYIQKSYENYMFSSKIEAISKNIDEGVKR
ncbi:hypothetical protein OFO10_07625 [Campylobacter sp. VBCF_06 NA8]|uniref:hypothetical protein n=1 Tax=unclassified Campylobacter TaxID=2593542 RepID=UPI0022EA0C90|nr:MULTISPECIES: hypothetical protein [unclassified Campylobacter]MDA3047024.1 hypothetical protein [Campylobacter sp. VBCF_06 NA8]MDA3054618.1 hypothetical protein [Campylobacter sp. VBCF_07 NA4]MDA3070136.1 hypothetical protein [Campylobacter sp. VBCF_08 NA3]MDA3075942.1 hypothetical protein [Campylobacter sp. JMF_04 NA10]WBR54570.1 hypothetical protein PF027_01505 [Campylobacter sp. VBCF_01 NA2]